MPNVDRLYYTDAYATRFTARLLDQRAVEEGTEVLLDQTLFYPTSGGQPHDTGSLNGVPVTDVFVRPEDNAVVHVTAGPVAAGEVTGIIDWDRRFDHMQQHTGQHILSQACIQIAGADTLSFHLGQQIATIDVPRRLLAEPELAEAERLANEIIWQNRPVTARLVAAERARELHLRKLPEVGSGEVRLVEIADFDLTACGGTHVSATGAVGLIKVLKATRRGEELRLEFVCGRRALADYTNRQAIISALVERFTTDYRELPAAVDLLRDEVKSGARRARRLSRDLARFEAAEMVAAGRSVNGALVVTQALTERDAAEIRLLAAELISRPGVVALLGLAGAKSQLLFARSADVPADAAELLRAALPHLAGATGGGSAAMAQGGGPAADAGAIQAALDAAVAHLEGAEG